MSLRWKIAGAMAIVAMLATVAVGVIGYRSTESRLFDEVDTALLTTAETVLRSELGNRVPERGVVDQYSVRRLNSNGRIVASSFESEPDVDPRVLRAVTGSPTASAVRTATAEDGERYRILSVGLRAGSAEIGRSLDETDAVLQDLRRRTILLVVLVAIGAAAIGVIIADRVARPLRRLAATAEDVSATGRLDADLSDVEGRDEVGRLGSSFSSMLGALARSRDDQERLVHDAGHELRTPLTSLRTNLGVLRRHADMPQDTRREILDDLDQEVGELTSLVNDLVAAASGSLDDERPTVVDLVAVARSTADRVGRRRQRSVDVRVEVAPATTVAAPVTPSAPSGTSAHGEPAIDVWIGRAGLERAVSNLIDNACKFDDSGGPIEVVVSSVVAPDGRPSASVRVLDRGPGLDPGEEQRVFDRFHRSEATRQLPGSGLGLSIVREVVTAAGGRVEAASRPDGGASVGFDLPVV
ncbi:MAG: HAMP domain-containing sensor histidine kinase, partial [Actinomycetota bacterium]